MRIRSSFSSSVVVFALALAAPVTATPTDDATTVVYTTRSFPTSLETFNNSYSETRATIESGVNGVTCNGTTYNLKISRSHPRHDIMYNTLLSALTTGKKVLFALETVGSECWVKRVRIVSS